jgi:hypothetical protein
VVAGEPQVGAHEGAQEHQETADGHKRRPPAPPAHRQAFVEQDGVDEPGDEGEDLLGVPTEEAALGMLGIEGAGDDAGGEQGKAGGQAPVIEVIQLGQGGQAAMEKAEVLALDLALLDQVEDAPQAGQGQGGMRQICTVSQKPFRRGETVPGGWGRMRAPETIRAANGATRAPRILMG